jgi:16S rRNA (cytosine967-C5)-methyltransferase
MVRLASQPSRAGLHNIATRLLASEIDRWVKRHKGGFDRVLVDAPCSGTGTWRRNPDARWREGSGLDTLLPLQAKIVASAARLVKPGGRLVYATCSLLAKENEAQVEGFLAAHPGWRVVPVWEMGSASGDGARVYPSLTPGRDGTDGFFGAVMERARDWKSIVAGRYEKSRVCFVGGGLTSLGWPTLDALHRPFPVSCCT